jgi:hypothetical protein
LTDFLAIVVEEPIMTNPDPFSKENMPQMPYTLLTEVVGRWKADVIESFLQAEEIDVVLIQETVSDLFTSTFAPVKIFVPNASLERAHSLLSAFNDSDEETGETEDGEQKED